ncbi:MAG: DUF1064 domain-containing protein [Simkania sp.]|nr:DUF1064 domain-containing protein [Simkania sp.]
MITFDEFMEKKKKSKFKNVRCERGEAKFASKLERSYYDLLVRMKQEGKIHMFLRQVPFHLPGNVRYVADYMVFMKTVDGSFLIDIVDVKGRPTDVYKLKKKMVEDLYGIKISEVKKGDF